MEAQRSELGDYRRKVEGERKNYEGERKNYKRLLKAQVTIACWSLLATYQLESYLSCLVLSLQEGQMRDHERQRAVAEERERQLYNTVREKDGEIHSMHEEFQQSYEQLDVG